MANNFKCMEDHNCFECDENCSYYGDCYACDNNYSECCERCCFKDSDEND